MYKKNIPLIYGFSFFINLVLHRGVFILYLLEKGITNSQIGILQSTLFIVNSLLEVPTGILGDRWGRKGSMLIACLLTLINTFGMAFSEDFYLFFLLFIVEAGAFAFQSGSQGALLYDSLKILKREGEYVRIVSRISSMSAVVLGLGMGIGGYLVQISWRSVYLGYGLSVAIATIFVLLIHEKKQDLDYIGDIHESDEKSPIENPITFLRTRQGKKMLFFLCGVGLYNSIMTPYFVYGQRLFAFYGLSEKQIALLFSIVQLSTGAIYLLAEKVSQRIPFTRLLYITLLSTSLFMVLNSLGSLFITLLVFYILMVFPDVTAILIDKYIQDKIPSKIRATLLSTQNFIDSAFIGGGYLLLGFLLDSLPVAMAFTVIGVIPLLAIVILFFYFRTEKGENPIVLEEACETG